ncbi:MAG: hypothetical protein M3Y58_23595 [Chloroflexota bacterium]|nr:hypothetical protein [Chloroflexota bacterium]
MARKRVLDPSIWTDDGMAELTPRQQLLYIGLISTADDAGRQKASPVAIRLSLPTIYANVLDGDIDTDLAAVLKRMRQLVAYIADDRRYLVFQNYSKWQRIDRPSASNLPAPPQPCENVRRSFDDQSSNVRPELSELKELTPPTPSRGVDDAKPSPKQRGTRIPADFALTPEMYLYAAEKGVTAAEADGVTEEFILYWQSASGRSAIKTDWKKAWMLRILDRLQMGKIGTTARIGSMKSNGYRSQADHNQLRRLPDGSIKPVY